MNEIHVLQVAPGLDAGRMLIGGKAASLVRLLNLAAPVPPAFVLTTDAYRAWEAGQNDDILLALLKEGVAGLEAQTGRKFGAPGHGGLLVSVRSGAPISMPGMMDTVLNVGFGPITGHVDSFTCDARTRFLWQFAELVIGIDSEELDQLRRKFSGTDPESVMALEAALRDEAIARCKTWPASAIEELTMAAKAVFASWQSSRAKLYRRMRKIDDSIGTSVTVQQMVFGNFDGDSGSGVAFTRDPTTGKNEFCGEFLFGGQGEEIVSGKETAGGLAHWQERQPNQSQQLAIIGKQLEKLDGKAQEIEFTVERGKLYVLQCRPALLTARAAARVAVDMCNQGVLTQVEAVGYARSHGFDPYADGRGIAVSQGAIEVARGLPVGGGVAVGRVAFGDAMMSELQRSGEPGVLLTVETSPNSLPLMERAAALVTLRGGATSHAAVVAREMGRVCVVGVGGELVDGNARLIRPVKEGDWITVDGDAGVIYAGSKTVAADTSTEDELRLRYWASEHDGEP